MSAMLAMQKYLYLWLQAIGAGHIVLGLALALGAQTALLNPYFDSLLSQFALAANDAAARTWRKV